jgi:uridylate kinase
VVYDGDPELESCGSFLAELRDRESIVRCLKVMDTTALSLCMDNGLPIYVFGLDDAANIERVARGERVGTIISTPRRSA